MNILVTGGAGFIGSRFAEMLVNGEIINNFERLIVVDKLTYSGNLENLAGIKGNSKFEFIQADICDELKMSSIINEYKISHVVNFAAETHVDRSINSSRPFFETNVLGTLSLLEASKKNAVVRYVQVSTDEVYGSIEKGTWEEDQPLAPNSPYSASKASADLLVRSYYKTYGMNVGITRCSNNYGIRQFPEKVIPRFITNLIEGKKVPIYGVGAQIREWIHIDDHSIAIFKVLMEGIPGDIYNIAGNLELKNIELAELLVTKFHKDTQDTFEYVQDRAGHDFRYSLSGNKIKKELGFESTKNFESEIEQIISWYKENESWWRPLLSKA